jgi:hypothetical protein
MKDWNGRKINFAKSKGGVIVVTHPFDNLISTNCIMASSRDRSKTI